ncbi:hypothetical protein Vretimale_17901 [Volvox reticuliferus]|uniref:Small acidic protein-like domain-containing protein n=1 Tax=Volvox reticuliferus TaxID=1737510 RepID=A0A8J4LYB8_9CHLO|nr:hypothetical protein Vretimale_17901 [Volvox reticuliferus]
MESDPEAIPTEETAAVTADTYEEELLDYDPHDEDLLAEELKAYGEEGLADVMSYEDGQGGAQARGTEVAVGQEAQDQAAVPFNANNQPEQKINSTNGSPQLLSNDGAPCPDDGHSSRDGMRRHHNDRDVSRNSDHGPNPVAREGGRSYVQRGAPERRPERGDDRRREDRSVDDIQHRQDRSASLDDRSKSRDADRGRGWDRERDHERDHRDSGERDKDLDPEHRGRERDRDWNRDRETDRSIMYDSERERLRARAREWELERTRLTGARHDNNHAAAGVVNTGVHPTLTSAAALNASPPGAGSAAAADSVVLREEHRVRAPYGPANMRREDPLPYQRCPKGSTPPNGPQERSGPLDRDQDRDGEQGPEREREREKDAARRDPGPQPEGDGAARWEREWAWERERDRDEDRRPLRGIDDRQHNDSLNLGSGQAREQPRSSSRDDRPDGSGRHEVGGAAGGSEAERPGGSGRSEYDRPRKSGQEYDRPGGSSRLCYDRPSVGGEGRPDYGRPGSNGWPEYDRQYAGEKTDQDRPIFSNRSEYDRAGPGTGRPEHDRGMRSESYDRLGGRSGSGLEYERSGPAGASRDRLIRTSSTRGLGDVREDSSRLETLPPGPGLASGPACSSGADGSQRRDDWGRVRDRDRDRDRGSYRNWELRDKDPRDKELWEQDRALRDRDRELRDREPRDRELRDRDLRDREPRDREPRDRELRDRELRDRDLRDRDPRDRELQDRDARDPELRDRDLRDRELRERDLRDRDLRDRDPRDREPRDREPRDRELRDRDPRDRDPRDRELRDRDPRDRDPRDRELRDRDPRDREPRDRELRDRDPRDRDPRDRELRDRDPRDRDPRDRELRDRKSRDRERDRSPERWGTTAAGGNGGGAYGADHRTSLPRGGSTPRDTADWRRWPSPLDRGSREFTPLTADTARGGGGAAEDAARRGEPWRRSSIENLRGVGGAAAASGADETARLMGGPGNGGEGGDGNAAAATAPRTRAPLFVGSVRPPPDVSRTPAASRQQQQRRSSPEPPAAHQQPPQQQQQLQASPASMATDQQQQQQQQPDALETGGETGDVGRGHRMDGHSGGPVTGSCMASSSSDSDSDSDGSPAAAPMDVTPEESGGGLGERVVSRWRNASDAAVGASPRLDASEPAADTRPPTAPAAAPEVFGRGASPRRTPVSQDPADGEAYDPAVHQNPLSRPCAWEDHAPLLPTACDAEAAPAATPSDAAAGDGAMQMEMATRGRQHAESSCPVAADWDIGAGSSARDGATALRREPGGGPAAGTGAGMETDGHGGDRAQQLRADYGKECQTNAPYSLQGEDRAGAQDPSSDNGRQRDSDSVPRARQPASQDSHRDRIAGAGGDIRNDDTRLTQPLHAEGRRDGGYEERRAQQHYSAGREVQRDDYDNRRRPAGYHGAQPPSSRDGSRRDPYDDGRVPLRRDDYSAQRPAPSRRKDEPGGDWRPRGPPPPSGLRRDEYDDRSRPSVGTARGPGRDDYLNHRPHAPHAPLPLPSNAAATATSGGEQRGDPHESRRSQQLPPGRGSEGYREREWAERGGGSSASTRGYGRDVGPGPRNESLSSDRSGWERERERHLDRDRDRDYRERERQREGLTARNLPSQGPPSYYRDAVPSGGGGNANRRPGSPPPAPKRPRTSPPRSGTGGDYPPYDHRQNQQPPPHHCHPPHTGPTSGGAAGAEGGALSSADIVRAMMAAPGGAPVAGMGTTGHAGPGGGGGGGFMSGPGSGSIATTGNGTVGTNSSQLTAEQKRKLLWGAKKVEAVVTQGAESLFGANRWDRAAEILETDRDKEKFQRLMGLKGDMVHRTALPTVEARPPSPGPESHLAMTREQQERVLGEVEQQYLAGLKRKDGRTAGLGM